MLCMSGIDPIFSCIEVYGDEARHLVVQDIDKRAEVSEFLPKKINK